MQTAGLITCETKTGMHLKKIRSRKPKAQMLIIHGLGEHSARHYDLAEILANEGIEVWLPDLRGHGHSPGKRGHIKSFSVYIDDLKSLVATAGLIRSRQTPFLIFGHSMGGLIAIHLCLQLGQSLQALVLSSPMLNLASDLPLVVRLTSGLLSAVFPSLTISNRINPKNLSHDHNILEDYIKDPLVHDQISFRWLSQCLKATTRAFSSASTIKIPVLCQLAGNDKIVDPCPSQRFFEKITSKDKTLIVYPGYYHEIFKETESRRMVAITDLIDWIGKRI